MTIDDLIKRGENMAGDDDRCEECGSLLRVEIQEVFTHHQKYEFVTVQCLNVDCKEHKIIKRRRR